MSVTITEEDQGLSDSLLYRAHDGINILVFLVLLRLYVGDSSWLLQDYYIGRFLHLLGFAWFFGGLIFASFVMSRYVWGQAALNHQRLAEGFRFILMLEFWCIPSVAMIAYGGMVMVERLGGLEPNPWAHQAYWFLLATPPILMIIPRFYHKRFIQDPEIDFAYEKRKAFWQDWIFIVLMALMMGALVYTMMYKTPLLG